MDKWFVHFERKKNCVPFPRSLNTYIYIYLVPIPIGYKHKRIRKLRLLSVQCTWTRNLLNAGIITVCGKRESFHLNIMII